MELANQPELTKPQAEAERARGAFRTRTGAPREKAESPDITHASAAAHSDFGEC